jgi:hypothetical protein
VTEGGTGLIARGPAPIAILNKIGDLPLGQTGSITASYQGTKILDLTVPAAHLDASNTATICRDWAQAKQ